MGARPGGVGAGHARHPEQAAARCADHLVLGGAETWLLLTTRRVAVVVESAHLAAAEAPAAEAAGELGRARSLARNVQDRFDTAADAATGPLAGLREAPIDQVREVRAVPRGRTPVPEWFVRIGFADGSAVGFRDGMAGQAVRTVHANLPVLAG
ncbi:hypothetical protein [Gandjariella thermophila]|uniref:Uncharacterized protein n=1 Tax=Gandjariella thermophila TaxID=1931992 RepID=A0A4D4JC84_9PSEU|nr:hypothetical protein [Gandjariella thermophila]GDY31473.1 hypothetical protein GTS_31060 [Gandjariella thermophila]